MNNNISIYIIYQYIYVSPCDIISIYKLYGKYNICDHIVNIIIMFAACVYDDILLYKI